MPDDLKAPTAEEMERRLWRASAEQLSEQYNSLLRLWSGTDARATTAEATLAELKGRLPKWSAKERRLVDELMAGQGFSEGALIRQAVRYYQMVCERTRAGETCVWSGDAARASEFLGDQSSDLANVPADDLRKLVTGQLAIIRRTVEERDTSEATLARYREALARAMLNSLFAHYPSQLAATWERFPHHHERAYKAADDLVAALLPSPAAATEGSRDA